jgi:hypothetical protein
MTRNLSTLCQYNFLPKMPSRMQKPKSISELIRVGGRRLTDLSVRSEARNATLTHVRAALPPPLAAAVVSAGLEEGLLTIGVNGAPWASRLRYVTDTLRMRVGATVGVDIKSVRIKVVPPRSPG